MATQPPAMSRGQKRQRVEDDWKCDCGHESEKECHMATEEKVENDRQRATLKMHKDVTTSIIVSNFTITTVLVNSGKTEKFSVHSDLLRLHSKFFQNTLSLRAQQETITINNIEPLQFASFISWVYSGEINDRFKNLEYDYGHDWENLWSVGAKLQSSGFQNYCIDGLRLYVKAAALSLDPDDNWPSRAELHNVIDSTDREGPLNQFAVDCLACNSPFKYLEDEYDVDEIDEWKAILLADAALSVAVNIAGAKDWGGRMPWDSKHRSFYIIPTKLLNEEFKTLMLRTETEEELEDKGAAAERISAAPRIKRSFFTWA